MAKTILEVKNLTKQFGKFTAVNNVSFSVKEGEIVGLLGPNGAGKTTTIMMILGIVSPTSGTVNVFSKDFYQHRSEALQDMNYSSAYSRLPMWLKVWEALYVFAQLYGIANSRERIDILLKAFGVESHRNDLIGDLSAGNVTRVSLCKAFINNPKLVLLDEPTASLDPDIADRVREYIRQSRERFSTTLLITSHNMAEIEELCDRVIFINRGKIIAEDTPESLAQKIQHTKLRLMMRDGQKRTIAYAKQHSIAIKVNNRYVDLSVQEGDVARILTDLSKIGVEYSEISIDKPTLEDFFITEVRHGA